MSVPNTMFAERLRTLMQERRLTQQALADKLKVSKQTISLWCSGTLPRDDKRPAIAEQLGTTESYLFYGGRVPPANLGEAIPNSTTAGFAVIQPLSGQEGSLRMSNTTLAQCRVVVSNARYLDMPDTSMMPTIPTGSLLAADTADRTPTHGKMYVLEQAGTLRVARVYPTPGGGVRLRFDNTSEYPDESYTAGDPMFPVVIARVFWYAVTLP